MVNKKHYIIFLFTIAQNFSFCQTWQQIGDFPSTERDDGTCFIIGNTAYCGTGLKTGWVQVMICMRLI